MQAIVERIEREAGVPGLVTVLVERLAPTDLQSLLLEVYRRRSGLRRPADVLAQYDSDRFIRPAAVPVRRLLAWEEAARTTRIDAQLFPPLQAEFASVECLVNEQRAGGRGYCRDLCFHIEAVNSSGRMLELVDDGVVDWSQRLLGSAKERMVISGIGSERLCAEF